MIATKIHRQTFPYSRRSAWSMLQLITTALRARFRFKPDIIFFHSTFALLPLLVLRVVSPNTRFVYCAHGWAGTREMKSPVKARAVRFIEGTLCGLAHRIVNVSEGEQQFAKRHSYWGRHVVLENAVAPAATNMQRVRFAGSEDSLHLLFVGRLDHQKGLDILLFAYAEARKANPTLQLHVIGEAVVFSESQGGARADLPVEGVDFLGWIPADSIDSYYAAADLLVVPSRWEAFGLVVAEALRNGTPVLVSSHANLPSLIEIKRTGFAVPLTANDFATVMAALTKNQLATMRPACLALFNSRYRSDRLGNQIMALYKELMG
jgi:glycosyltransferase involved in cell wall biosynthesis